MRLPCILNDWLIESVYFRLHSHPAHKKFNIKNKQPYCLMPWIHFHTGNDGIAQACCVANIPYGNINKESFNTIWNGDRINQLRQKFAKGELDKRCAYCYKLEATGGTSIRQETFEKFSNIDVSKIESPIYFDIRFSNVCNYKCRTCWHGASSAWFDDAKKLGTNKGQKAVIKNVEDFDDFIQKVGPSLLNAKEIYLAGGEPLVTEEHYQLLHWLIANNATQMKLRYNTNFSVLEFKGQNVLELWSHFENVEILASIDAVEELGEYIRTGSKWIAILANHQKIKHLPNITFKISPTISVLNMAHLPDLIKECVKQDMIDFEGLYINILERPIHYNVQIFPNEQKQTIDNELNRFINELRINHSSTKMVLQIQECIDYMWANDLSKHWPKFEKENGNLDKLRGDM